MAMTRDAAETLALRALGWLAANEELMPVFLGSSGADAETLGDAARDPAFLGAVLDFIVMDDGWVMAFCDAEGVAYDQPFAARAMLPGGDQVHWT